MQQIYYTIMVRTAFKLIHHYALHKLSPQDPALAGPTLGNGTFTSYASPASEFWYMSFTFRNQYIHRKKET